MENKERYQQFIMEGKLTGLDKCVVGYVYDRELKEPVLGIYIDKQYLIDTCNQECVINYGNSSRRPLVVVSNQLARKLQRDSRTAWFQVFHELGHLTCGHDKNRNPEVDPIRYRIEAVMSGGVDEHELEADAFAVSIVGPEIAKKTLKNQLLERRKHDRELHLEESALSRLCCLEYRRRIMAIEHPELAE